MSYLLLRPVSLLRLSLPRVVGSEDFLELVLMDVIIPPLEVKNMLEANLLISRVLLLRLAVSWVHIVVDIRRVRDETSIESLDKS